MLGMCEEKGATVMAGLGDLAPSSGSVSIIDAWQTDAVGVSLAGSDGGAPWAVLQRRDLVGNLGPVRGDQRLHQDTRLVPLAPFDCFLSDRGRIRGR